MNIMSSTNNLAIEKPSDEFTATVLKSLKCAVNTCSNYVYKPIKQCSSGHCLCKTCSSHSSGTCPKCGGSIIKARNLSLEAISSKLIRPCIYQSKGCPQALPQGYEMTTHEISCQFRLYNCFAGKCSWTGQSHNILEHMQSCHKERVFIGTEKVFKIRKLDNREDMDIIYFFSCQMGDFWAKIIYKKLDLTFYGAVQYIGDINMASLFTYWFEIQKIDENSGKKWTYYRTTHEDVTNFETIFKNHDCFCIPISIAKYFADNDILSIKLNIESTDNS